MVILMTREKYNVRLYDKEYIYNDTEEFFDCECYITSEDPDDDIDVLRFSSTKLASSKRWMFVIHDHLGIITDIHVTSWTLDSDGTIYIDGKNYYITVEPTF
jgi:hypothetical protein